MRQCKRSDNTKTTGEAEAARDGRELRGELDMTLLRNLSDKSVV